MAMTPAQAAALTHLRSTYVGPEQGEHEVLLNRPSLRYVVGMLFPPEPLPAEPDPGDVNRDAGLGGFVHAEVDTGEVEEGGAAAPLAEDWRPSSVAVSFVTDRAEVYCDFTAATYEPEDVDGVTRWHRRGRTFPDVLLTRATPHKEIQIGNSSVQLGSRWRRHQSGFLVTVHVRLLTPSTGDPNADIPLMLFQVGLSVRPAADGRILRYEATGISDLDSEARELRLRYRHHGVYAVGHGMAAAWDTDDKGRCTRVYLDPVPAFVVPAMAQTGLADPSSISARSLELDFLETIDEQPKAVTDSLLAFVDEFSAWVRAQADEATALGEDAKAIVERATRAEARMREGVALLKSADQSELRTAFSLAMAAMRMQMAQAALSRGETNPAPRWRPFQLGFLLVALASTTNDQHADRDLVDLIWFPTGGGKTEAYLGLAAITMLLRRLRHGTSGAGTAVITRYTLRLLTSQQFQRAASLVCALEILRNEDPRASGMPPFSIGLWVGNAATPGTRADAMHALERLLRAAKPREANSFQVTECPWCLTDLIPESREEDHLRYGFRKVGNDVALYCVNRGCPFASRELPMAVVDEVLYENPPTVLLATVDKFARLQFNEKAKSLLGLGTPYRQPSLVIQDELHLLSGPLGTTVAVFDAVVQLLLSNDGSLPKIIASTATIRSSSDQVKGLYGRNVALYPPAGLNGDATFFAEPAAGGYGRLYLGLMPQSISQASALVAATAPLLELPFVVQAQDGIDGRLDPYWTLVMYHNSLRELGRSSALLLDDINARLEARTERLAHEARQVRAPHVLELTSRRSPEDLPKDLRQLRISADDSRVAVDVVLSSNMLSVGVDVQRLALMLMVGQPKTTAEYIQATSRVGRGSVNGIVVTLFRPNRARDRSHFETFMGFHQSLYRSVEPTSVTPWSLSSRDRSLAGALVTLVRHSFPQLAPNAAAGNFRLGDPHFRTSLEGVVARFLEKVEAADEREAPAVAQQIWAYLREWDWRAEKAREEGRQLAYERTTHSPDALLKRFGQSGEGWLVGDSMRSVEPNVAIEVQEPLEEVRRAEDPT